jgi:hypothetical protein
MCKYIDAGMAAIDNHPYIRIGKLSGWFFALKFHRWGVEKVTSISKKNQNKS